MNKTIFACCILCLGFYQLFGQSGSGDSVKASTHLILGVGGSYVSVIDEGISPLLYKGIGGTVLLGHYQEKSNSINTSNARFDFNNPSSSISNAEMYTYRLEGYFQKYWKLKNDDLNKVNFRPGFDLSAKWALRQHLSFSNNSQHIETRFSLAPSIMMNRAFSLWKRSFEIGIFQSMPLFTYATRPLFASTRFPASVNKEVEFMDYVKGGDLVSLGSYFKWKSQAFLKYEFHNENAIRLDYYWSYETYKAMNPVRTGEHSITISALFKI